MVVSGCSLGFALLSSKAKANLGNDFLHRSTRVLCRSADLNTTHTTTLLIPGTTNRGALVVK